MCFSDSLKLHPSQNFHRAGLLEGQQSAILKHIVWVCKGFLWNGIKWESVKLCKLIQCSFLLKSLILLLEQLNVSVDFVAVFDVLVSYCTCFWEALKKPQNHYKLCVGCYTFEFQILIIAFYKQIEYEKLKQNYEYNKKSDTKHILSLKIQNFYMMSISIW